MLVAAITTFSDGGGMVITTFSDGGGMAIWYYVNIYTTEIFNRSADMYHNTHEVFSGRVDKYYYIPSRI